jgi:acetyl esterase/lipase
MRKLFFLFLNIILILKLTAQTPYTDAFQSRYKPLYAGAIPNAKPTENKQKTEINKNNHVFTTNISVPTIARFDPPAKLKNGTAIIICPGGGYWGTADKHEGTDVAQLFNKWGITAFVLRYRMPDKNTMIDPSVGALQDAQQAIRWVRQNAKTWGLKENQIGIMGFSAGGHLAATATTHFAQLADPSVSDTTSVRPDFSMLIYGVISFKPELTHGGSRDRLLVDNMTEEKILHFSNEEQITAQTPPTFLVHAADDGAVPVGNSIEYYKQCVKLKVPAEMHLYPKGGHGFGMLNTTTKDQWTDRLKNWLDGVGVLKK